MDSYKDIVNRIRSNVTLSLPDVDPTITGSVIRAVIDAFGAEFYDLYLQLERATNNMFPDTAEDEFLERWGRYEGLEFKPAIVSSGSICIPSTTTTTVSILTEFISSSGNIYILQANVSTSLKVSNVSSLVAYGYTVTATTESAHNYGTGITVTISGATPTEYNGNFVITVISETEFTYEVDKILTPASGTITSNFLGGFGIVKSKDGEGETDSTVNLENSAKLRLIQTIPGIEPTSYVSYAGIVGGVIGETNLEYRDRIYNSRKYPVANFNIGQIQKVALSVDGVTRVKVKPVTPDVGDVTVLFVRDNDETSIIPTPAQEAEVKDAILEYLPVNSYAGNVFVSGPTPINVDFIFNYIFPDTPNMRQAIEENIIAMFQDQVEIEAPLLKSLYDSAIYSTIDLLTGEKLVSFGLDNPTGDILIEANQLVVLNNVIFNIP